MPEDCYRARMVLLAALFHQQLNSIEVYGRTIITLSWYTKGRPRLISWIGLAPEFSDTGAQQRWAHDLLQAGLSFISRAHPRKFSSLMQPPSLLLAEDLLAFVCAPPSSYVPYKVRPARARPFPDQDRGLLPKRSSIITCSENGACRAQTSGGAPSLFCLRETPAPCMRTPRVGTWVTGYGRGLVPVRTRG